MTGFKCGNFRTVLTFLAVVGALSTSTVLLAQQMAVVSGTVLDAAGQALPNATVVVKNDSTPARKTTSGSDGRFQLEGVRPGTYTLEVSAPNFTTTVRNDVAVGKDNQPLSFTLKVADFMQAVTVEAAASIAEEKAPVRASLDALSPKSEITPEFVQNFISPNADYTEVTLMAPGTFSISPNGVGLGDSKTYFRGFSDGQYTMTYDGIPFNDTNSPSHHSWAFFPSQWIGRTDFDRSPGQASTIGPTNFGGSINLNSREIPAEMGIRAGVSYSSFNTRLLDLNFDSGSFGLKEKKSSLIIDLHELRSDGYQTYNYQKRDGGSGKYQYKLTPKTTLTLFTGIIDLWSNTPNIKGPTRAQIAQFGDNYLLSGDPTNPSYFRFNYYHVQTDFEYAGIHSELGRGWILDSKLYTYRYWNKQNYNGTTIATTSATDKLNGYRKAGDETSVSHTTKYGVFRTGLWYEWAYTDRYQIPSDPRSGVNALLPNFHEHFITTSTQPYAEYQAHLTRRLTAVGGIKLAHYNMHLNQFADNGSTVGCLGGKLNGPVAATGTSCVGGAQFVTHNGLYNSWMPSVALRYRLRDNLSVYSQYAVGSVIPPSSVFDVAGANVRSTPKPTKTDTYQVGSVFKLNRLTLDGALYYIRFQNSYTSVIDPITTEAIYVQTGDTITKGAEIEGTLYVAKGLSAYVNATYGRAKYVNNGLYLANSPKNTEAIGLTYQRNNWDVGFFNKRIGPMYNDNKTINEAVYIDPFHITNMFFNYTIKGNSALRGTKLRFGINNLFDQHSIVAVTPASTKTSIAAPGDILTLLAARSFSISLVGGYAPRR